jgi:hypothetical protein
MPGLKLTNIGGALSSIALNSPTITGTVSGVTSTMVGLGNVTNTSDLDKPVSTLQQTALNLKAPLASPTFTGTVTIPTGASIIAPTGLTKGDVGLGNVTNTSDANKPVSTQQQTALDLKLNLTDPSIEYYITDNGTSSYLVNGVENGNIYLEKGKKYKIHVNATGHPFWIQTISGGYSSGNVYSSGITNNGTAKGYIDIVLPSNAPQLYYVCGSHSSMAGSIIVGNRSETYKSMASLNNVDNTTDLNKPVSTLQQTELNLKANVASPTLTGAVRVSSLPSGVVHTDASGVLSSSQIITTDIQDGAITSAKLALNLDLSGNPTAPTQDISDNSTKIATTAFVKNSLSVMPVSDTDPINPVNGQFYFNNSTADITNHSFRIYYNGTWKIYPVPADG